MTLPSPSKAEPTTDLVAVVTTTGSRADALRLARLAVEGRLAACAQVSPIESVYVWQGAVQHEPEYRLVLKTTAELRAALEAALAQAHPYQVPAILTVPLAHANRAYADWVRAETTPARSARG